ncbi:MAG: threonine--tRNA ligase [Legionellales bacterium]|mgnify:CR=1 FL=1|nr:threonine--tRNA ligase [Legionellales bacterium]|tara:strand:- start:13698 stop:15620 length:1923 start_codon:yes stop_codon:yes gene_type:complete
MLRITLPDGSQRQFEGPVTVADIAGDIGAGLAKAALAGTVNGQLVDTSFTVAADSDVAIITDRDPEGLEVLRHSCAHLLAQAVKQLFPTAQVTIGPVVEYGFYYDFAFGRSFTPEDLERIEAKMKELAKQDLPVSRQEMGRDEAIQFFRDMGEEYKAKIIEDIPEDETLSLYQQGDFIDLCRGPHVPSTGRLKAFKLMKLAGAYWRGDANNEMLQRIYGTAWANKKDLQAHLERLEEAEKRDHRKLGKQLDLFHFQDIAPGMAYWHPKGWSIYQVIEQYIRSKLKKYSYNEIRTPQLADRSLWEKSGHWDKYHEEMFITQSEDRTFAIKPMNCPGHVQVFKQGFHSYRDLPMRLAEFGSCHRDEPSGTLHGLMRVRNFVQDDAHIFCTEDQIQSEVSQMLEFVFEVYKDFGFTDLIFKLSTRPERRIGSDAIWDKAEKALEIALDNKGLDWELNPGDGAFYGPKIDFSVRDCLERVWQCATIQVDFSMPERLGATYVAEDGSRQHPVMLHRAILGSVERFMGVLIEHYAGKLPTWLAPNQVVVMNITDRQAEYCKKITESLKNLGFRAISDLRNEKIGFKIREHTLQRVPYQLVIGDKELEAETLSVRTQSGDDLGAMSLAQFTEVLERDIASFSGTAEE